ncbi:MAG: hypothetical protein ACXQTE_01225 [Methanosarcinaceae archaeon]
MVQTNNNPPSNTDISYTDDAVFGNHELKVEAEKSGVLVSKSWTWNVDEVVGTCSKTHMSISGDVYIKIENATLYKRPNGTYYLDVDWFVQGCERLKLNYNFPAPCEMIVTTSVSWDYLGIPGEPSPYPPDQEQEIDSCSGSGSNTFEVQSRECSVSVNLYVKCYAYFPPIPPKILVGSEEDSCSCSIGNQ